MTLVVVSLGAVAVWAAAGDLIWVDRFDTTVDDFLFDLDTDGKSVISLSTDLWVQRPHNARSGALLWADRADITPGQVDAARTITMDGNRVVAAGYTENPGRLSSDLIVRSYQGSNGALRWQDRFADPGGGFAVGLESAAEGGVVVVTGTLTLTGTTPAASYLKVFVRAYDGRSGLLLREDTFDHGDYTGQPDVVMGGGRVFVRSIGGSEGRISAYDAASGIVLWRRNLGNGRIGTFAVGPSLVFVAASVASSGVVGDWVVTAHDVVTGVEIWRDTLPGLGRYGARVVTLHEGVLYAAGFGTNPGPDPKIIVRALDAITAAVLWTDDQDFDSGPFSDRVDAIVAAKVKGRVRAYVGGSSVKEIIDINGLTTFDRDALVLAYDGE